MVKFILIVVIIYVIYYAVNIVYDGFLKKTNVQENNDGDEFVIDDDQPKIVTVNDIDYNGDYSSDGSVGGRQIEMSVEESNIINGNVEDQGFTVNNFLSEIDKQLLGESKQMFAGVAF